MKSTEYLCVLSDFAPVCLKMRGLGFFRQFEAMPILSCCSNNLHVNLCLSRAEGRARDKPEKRYDCRCVKIAGQAGNDEGAQQDRKTAGCCDYTG